MSYKRVPMGYVPGLVDDTSLDSLRALSTQKGVSTTKPANVGPGPLDFLKNIVGGVFSGLTNPPMQAAQLPSAPMYVPPAASSSISPLLIIGGVGILALVLLKRKG